MNKSPFTRYITADQAAEYLGFGTGLRGAARIRVMVHRREIPFNKIGARLRFDTVELDKWMKERAKPVVQAQAMAG